MKNGDKINLEKRARSLINNSNRKVSITPVRFQRDQGITNPSTARYILSELHKRKVLLKHGPGEVYYVNPNQPRALSPYSSRRTRRSLR